MSRSSAVPPDRGPYRDDQLLIARTETDGDLVTIFNLRDKHYPAVDEVEVNWDDRDFDLRGINDRLEAIAFADDFSARLHER